MKTILLTLAVLVPTTALADCPIGTHPWVDRWGNNICQRWGGGTATIEGSLDNCPIGTHPWVDTWGNRVCKSTLGGTQYYDTSEGCPVGTYEWPDFWGNPSCKRF